MKTITIGLLLVLLLGATARAVDTVVSADYDGDGKVDFAVYESPSGHWYIEKSGGGVLYLTWGTTGDIPAPADYDRDGKADPAVYRPSNRTLYILKSSCAYTCSDSKVVPDWPGPPQ